MTNSMSDARIYHLLHRFIDDFLSSDSNLTVDERKNVQEASALLKMSLGPHILDSVVDPSRDLNFVRDWISKSGTSEEAERLKTEGNEIMRMGDASRAVGLYSKAIQLHPLHAIYYCNRAAAYAKLGQLEECVTDCSTAIGCDPFYSKAHARLGAALIVMGDREKARFSLQKALELDPNNASAAENLKVIDQNEQPNVQQPPPSNPMTNLAAGAGVDLGSLLNNPALMNMATQLISNPQVQNMMSSMFGNLTQPPSQSSSTAPSTGLNELFQAGQRIASSLASSQPNLIETLRNLSTSGSGQQQNREDDKRNEQGPDGSGQ